MSDRKIADPVQCPYLSQHRFSQEYFLAAQVDEFEMENLLSAGWRRFGRYFFRPRCAGCHQCIPIRVDVNTLSPSKSQRRVIRKAKDIDMKAMEPRNTEEIWQLFRKHSLHQFQKQADRGYFEQIFFDPTCPLLITEYRMDKKLIAAGFVHWATESLNSMYYIFDPDWANYSLGTLSVFREAQLAKSMGLRWYYLGYWVKACSSMSYKARFQPHQCYNWQTGHWGESF